jgi:O-antigen ligase
MVIVKRIFQTIKEQPLAAYTFSFLGICLFLSDGKTAVIDLYGAIWVLGLCFIARLYGGEPRPHNRPALVLWGALLLYLVIRTMFSDDVGYSVYSILRYVEAFCIYYVFSRYSNRKTLKIIVCLFLYFAVFALACAMVLTALPSWSKFLSSMNLLYPTYGHNRVVDILIIAFTFSTVLWYQTRKTGYLFLTFLFISGTLISFARAVLALETVLVLAILVHSIISKTDTKTRISTLLLGMIALTVVVVFVLPLNISNKVSFLPKYMKLPIPQDGRLEYWRQAAYAISERPIFGSGPGTYYMQSIRIQKAPLRYSWFAHNYTLETTSELGVAGLLLIAGLVISICRTTKTPQRNRYWYVLILGICMALAESFVDYNLNYLALWIFLWASAGVLFPTPVNGRRKDCPILYLLAIVFLVGFIIVTWYLNANRTITGKNTFYTTVCTYDTGCALSLLNLANKSLTTLTDREKKLIQFFHKQNAGITLRMARYEKLNGASEASYALYEKMLDLDPQFNTQFQEYISYLLAEKEYNRLPGVFGQILAVVSRNKQRDSEFINKYRQSIIPCLNDRTIMWPGNALTYTYHARTIYFTGLCLIQAGQADAGRELLQIAVEADTGWSNIYIDSAALLTWRYDDISAAQRSLELCRKNVNSRGHCTYYDTVPLPTESVTDPSVKFIN